MGCIIDRFVGLRAVVMVTVLVLAAPAIAQDAPSRLDVTEGQEYIGTWLISMEFGDMKLEFVNDEGKLGGILTSDRMPEPQKITNIAKTDDGLVLKWDSEFGELIMSISGEAGGLSGTLGNASGDFSTELSGIKEGSEEADEESGSTRRRVRRSLPETTIERGEKSLKITYSDLPVDGPDYANISKLAAGDVLLFTMSNPPKLRIDEDLKFGDLDIKVGNAAENYPGVYSLWLKRAEDGWQLVFNNFPDVWGTQYNPKNDAGAIPLAYERAAEATEKLAIEMTSEGNDGVVKIAWGDHVWTAKFAVVG